MPAGRVRLTRGVWLQPLAVPGCAAHQAAPAAGQSAPAAGQAAGRHHLPPRGSPRQPPSLLLVDYPAANTPFAVRRAGTFAPVTSRRGGLRSVGYDVALAVALTCLAAAVLVGIALAHSRVAAPGARAAPGLPQPGALLPPPGATSPSPVASPHRAHRSAGPGRRRTTKTRPRPGPEPVTRNPVQPPVQKPAVVVRYRVTSRGPAGFRGEIQVINNTAQPIGNWQIVVTLYDDAVASVANADGDFSNGILLLSPASPAQVAPPDGGVLDIFFTADGFQTVPEACAFDGIYCRP